LVVGRRYTLSVSCEIPGEATLEPATASVVVEPCVPGERHAHLLQQCVTCPSDSLLVDNRTGDACESCADRPGIVCTSWGRDSGGSISDDCIDQGLGDVECAFRGGNAFALQPGYWMSSNAFDCYGAELIDPTKCILSRVYACDEPATERCPGNVEAWERQISFEPDRGTLSGVSFCGPGYDPEVVLCGSCLPGYQTGPDGLSCEECPPGDWTVWLQLAGVLCAFFVLLSLVAWFLSRSAGSDTMFGALQSGEELEGVTGDLGDIMEEFGNIPSPMPVINVIAGYLQVMGLQTNIFSSVNISGGIKSFMDGLSVFNFPIVRLLSLQCLAHSTGMTEDTEFFGSFYASFIYYLLLPLIIPMLCGTLYVVAMLRNNARMRRLQIRLDELEKKKQTRFNRAMVTLVREEMSEAHEGLKQNRAVCFKLTVFLITFLHPSISAALFELFNCEPIHMRQDVETGREEQWLKIDRSIECFVPQWRVYGALSFVGIGFIVFGWPLFVLILLRHYHSLKMIRDPDGGTEPLFVPEKQLVGVEPEEQDEDEIVDVRSWTWTWVKPKGGGEVKVKPYVTISLGDGGVKTYRLMHKLDTGRMTMYYGPFFADYEDSFYWWQCYEMVRRLLQTSVVIIINIFSPGLDVPFALLVSVIALSLHAFCRPYTDDDPDYLQFVVLMNQFVLCFVLVVKMLDLAPPWVETLLMVLQIALVLLALRFVYRVVYPSISGMMDQGKSAIELSKNLTRRSIYRWKLGTRRLMLAERCVAVLQLQLGSREQRVHTYREHTELPEVRRAAAELIQGSYRRSRSALGSAAAGAVVVDVGDESDGADEGSPLGAVLMPALCVDVERINFSWLTDPWTKRSS